MADKQANNRLKKSERRSDAKRRHDRERRGALRWDPKNNDRREGEERRNPGCLSDDDTPEEDC